MQVAGLMGVAAHKASDTAREAAQAAVERAEAGLRAAQDNLQHASGKACCTPTVPALSISSGALDMLLHSQQPAAGVRQGRSASSTCALSLIKGHFICSCTCRTKI